MNKKKVLLKLENVNKIFKVGKKYIRKTHAVKDANLEVYQGEFIIIMGPSGCGKSTLLNMIAGLEEPNAGRVILDGKTLNFKNKDRLAEIRHNKIGMIYQRVDWIKSLNVLQNVALPLWLTEKEQKDELINKKAAQLIEEIGLKERLHYRPMELSGGEQQKAAISRALITNPSLILADEPTGNLDSKAAYQILDIFHELNKKDKRTIILVTHNQNYKAYGSRLVLMEDGHVIKT